MSSRALVIAVAIAAVAVAACSSDPGENSVEVTSTTSPTLPAVGAEGPAFTGDPDSPFCQLVSDAASAPVRDPFEPGLDPIEVQVRFRALQLRFTEFGEISPVELRTDLEALVASLDRLGELLAEAGYDFERLAGIDSGAFDDPQFADAAARIDRYRVQVCR